jgi:hypothetical protein
MSSASQIPDLLRGQPTLLGDLPTCVSDWGIKYSKYLHLALRLRIVEPYLHFFTRPHKLALDYLSINIKQNDD